MIFIGNSDRTFIDFFFFFFFKLRLMSEFNLHILSFLIITFYDITLKFTRLSKFIYQLRESHHL